MRLILCSELSSQAPQLHASWSEQCYCCPYKVIAHNNCLIYPFCIGHAQRLETYHNWLCQIGAHNLAQCSFKFSTGAKGVNVYWERYVYMYRNLQTRHFSLCTFIAACPKRIVQFFHIHLCCQFSSLCQSGNRGKVYMHARLKPGRLGVVTGY